MTPDQIFIIIDLLTQLIKRSNMSREEKDEANKKIKEIFNSLPHPSTLKDTVKK